MACNLRIDPTAAADLTGPAGTSATVTIKGTNGNASIVAALYNQKSLTPPTPTLTIVKGDALLDLMVNNTLPGDVTTIACVDGTILKRFRFDRNNPAILLDVRGV